MASCLDHGKLSGRALLSVIRSSCYVWHATACNRAIPCLSQAAAYNQTCSCNIGIHDCFCADSRMRSSAISDVYSYFNLFQPNNACRWYCTPWTICSNIFHAIPIAARNASEALLFWIALFSAAHCGCPVLYHDFQSETTTPSSALSFRCHHLMCLLYVHTRPCRYRCYFITDFLYSCCTSRHVSAGFAAS